MAHITDVAGLISSAAAGGNHTIAGNTTYRLTSQLVFNVAGTVITATGPQCIISGGDPITTWVQSGSTWVRTAALTDHPMGLRDDTKDGRDLVYHMAANPTASVQDWNKGVSSWHVVTAASGDPPTQLAIATMSLISAGTRMHVETFNYAGHNVRVTAVAGGLATFTPATAYGIFESAGQLRRGRVRVLNRTADLAACGAGHFVYDSVTDVMTVIPHSGVGFSAATTLYASQSWGSTPSVLINVANVQLIGITFADKVEDHETFNTSSQMVRFASGANNARITNCHSRNLGRWLDVRNTTGTIIHGGTTREGFGGYHYISLGNNILRGHGFTKMGRSASEAAIVHMTPGGTVANNWFNDIARYCVFFPNNNVIIEKNICYRVCRRNPDTGCFYTISGGSAYPEPAVRAKIRNNYIRDVEGASWVSNGWRGPFYSGGVYYDNGTGWCDTIGNVIDGWSSFGIFVNQVSFGSGHLINYNIFAKHWGENIHFPPFSAVGMAAIRCSGTSQHSYNAIDASCVRNYQGATNGTTNCTPISLLRRANDIAADPQIVRNSAGWIIGLASTSPLKAANVGWTDPAVTTWGPRGLGFSGEWDAITGFGPSGGGSPSGTATATPAPPSSPATIDLSEWNGTAGILTNKNSETVRFKKADNAVVDALNRIPIPDNERAYSYEKWLRLGISGGGPLNKIQNIRFYTDGTNSFGTGIRLWAEVSASETYRAPALPDNANTTPLGGSASRTMTNAFTYTALGTLSLSSATATFSGTSTNIGAYVVLVMGVDPCADAGTLTPESLRWSYDET